MSAQMWWREKRLILTWGVLVAAGSVLLSLFFPKWYRAESSVLIITPWRVGFDPYTQAKSAERLGQNLAQVLRTTDFFNAVMGAEAAGFDRARWQGLTPRQQRRRWQREVGGSMVYNSSILRLWVLAPARAEAAALGAAVTEAVARRGPEYLGADLMLRVVDPPLVGSWPARPNLPLNAAVGFVIGAGLAALWVARYRRPRIFGG